MLVTRGAERDREFADRLGGSRIQLLRQLLVEGLLLSAGAAVVGLLLATQTFDMLETLIPSASGSRLAPRRWRSSGSSVISREKVSMCPTRAARS
jgi:hypothetical protein